MMNPTMIVGEEGKAMRLTTTIMMKGNMKSKLMKNDMRYVVYKMIKYSFNNDLTITSDEACRAYQEIFQMMDEGWMVTRNEWDTKEKSNLKTSLTLEAKNIDKYWWRIYKSGDLEVLES
ncbi:hypothetical protein Tco_0005287 [Tanacetum coccineum]